VKTIEEIADEGNAIVAKIESKFGTIRRRKTVFADRTDAELWLARMQGTYRAMSRGWAEQEAANKREAAEERRRRVAA
jgi:glutathione S-transferase